MKSCCLGAQRLYVISFSLLSSFFNFIAFTLAIRTAALFQLGMLNNFGLYYIQ